MQLGSGSASRKQITLAGLVLVVGLTAVVFSLLQPFRPGVELTLDHYRRDGDRAVIRLDDQSLTGRLVYARPDLTPIVAMEDASGFQQEQHSTTAAWRRIPVDGITFESPPLSDQEFPISLSIYIKSRFSDAQARVTLSIEGGNDWPDVAKNETSLKRDR